MAQQSGPNPLPRELYFKQRRLLEWQITHPADEQVDQIHLSRWDAVCKALDAGYRSEDESAYEEAERTLLGTPAAGRPGTMKRSYDKMQRELPKALQRPRTHRPKRKPVG